LDEKLQALDIIKSQYSDKQFEFPEDRLKATAVIIPFSIKMFRNKGLGHKWLEKKSISLGRKNAFL